jgi:predicted Fe-Mo cluster-binding NifX family protein
MKIAIPVFQTKISPRFDQTQGFIVVETEKANVISKKHLSTIGWTALDKMRHLVSLRIDTLICGGIDRASLQYLSFNGLTVYSWVTGEVDDALACFLDNRMKPGLILGANGKMMGRWRFCKGTKHLCNMFRTSNLNAEKGVNTMPRGDGTGPQGPGPRSGRGRGGCKGGKGGRGGGRGQGQRSGQGKGRGSGQGSGATGRQNSGKGQPQPQQ